MNVCTVHQDENKMTAVEGGRCDGCSSVERLMNRIETRLRRTESNYKQCTWKMRLSVRIEAHSGHTLDFASDELIEQIKFMICSTLDSTEFVRLS